MENVKVIRKTLAGSCTPFEFEGTATDGTNLAALSSEFLVKNFSDNDCFVDFVEITNENVVIKIPAKTAQVCMLRKGSSVQTNTVFVKGTGEIEVQAL